MVFIINEKKYRDRAWYQEKCPPGTQMYPDMCLHFASVSMLVLPFTVEIVIHMCKYLLRSMSGIQ